MSDAEEEIGADDDDDEEEEGGGPIRVAVGRFAVVKDGDGRCGLSSKTERSACNLDEEPLFADDDDAFDGPETVKLGLGAAVFVDEPLLDCNLFLLP